MSKMFVHYSGTINAFKEAGLEAKYDKHIVFIKGGVDGTGAAVFTHGNYYGDVKEALAALTKQVNELSYFSGIRSYDKDGNEIKALATDKNGIITFNATDPSQVSVDVTSKGVNFGLSKTFTDSVAANTAAISAEQGRAEGVETKLRGDLGEKLATEDTAFNRIKSLEAAIAALTAGGEGSVSSQITSAIEALDAEVTSTDGAHVAVKVTEVDGKVTAVNVSESDIASAALLGTAADDATKATAFGKAAEAKAAADAAKTASETAASNAQTAAKNYTDEEITKAKTYAEEKASAAETAAKGYTDGKVSEINEAANALAARVEALDKENTGRVALVEGRLNVIEGEGDGSIKKAVADGIAGVIASAPEDFDTLKEVADWIASDTTGSAKMQSDIATLKGDETVTGSVLKTVKDAVDAEAAIAREAEQNNANAIAKEVADRGTAISDLKTELEGRISDFETEYANDEKVIAESLTDLDNRIKALVGEDSAIRGEFAQAVAGEKSRAEGQEAAIRSEFAAADTATLAAANKYTDDAIAALDVTDAAVENQFVTAVSETDGKISVSRSAISASQIGIINTENDAFAAATANVQDALTELASFWAWEEL